MTSYLRDRSRDNAHKLRTLTRRADRRAKSTALFLAFAFPADQVGAHAGGF